MPHAHIGSTPRITNASAWQVLQSRQHSPTSLCMPQNTCHVHSFDMLLIVCSVLQLITGSVSQLEQLLPQVAYGNIMAENLTALTQAHFRQLLLLGQACVDYLHAICCATSKVLVRKSAPCCSSAATFTAVKAGQQWPLQQQTCNQCGDWGDPTSSTVPTACRQLQPC